MTTNEIYKAILNEQRRVIRRRKIVACFGGATFGLLLVEVIFIFSGY